MYVVGITVGSNSRDLHVMLAYVGPHCEIMLLRWTGLTVRLHNQRNVDGSMINSTEWDKQETICKSTNLPNGSSRLQGSQF
jgi:hypothetical protein